MTATWSDEHVERLRAMWGRKSAKDIGRALGFTADAVIGKAHRLKLERLQGGPRAVGRTPRIPRARRAVCIPDYESVAEAEANLPPTDDPFGPDGCRWVIGDPAQPGSRFCQHRRSVGSFCRAHATLAYRREIASPTR